METMVSTRMLKKPMASAISVIALPWDPSCIPWCPSVVAEFSPREGALIPSLGKIYGRNPRRVPGKNAGARAGRLKRQGGNHSGRVRVMAGTIFYKE